MDMNQSIPGLTIHEAGLCLSLLPATVYFATAAEVLSGNICSILWKILLWNWKGCTYTFLWAPRWFRPAFAQQTALVGDHFREERVGHRWIIFPHSSSLLSDSLNPPDPPEISNQDSFSLGLPTYFLRLLGDGAGEAARRRARAEQLEAFAARERQAQNIGFLQGRGIRRMGFGMLDVWICQNY